MSSGMSLAVTVTENEPQGAVKHFLTNRENGGVTSRMNRARYVATHGSPSLALLSGCVSTGEYQDLETKYQHQLAVEVMETEHDELSQRVDNVSQVYRHVAQGADGDKGPSGKTAGDILTVKGVVKRHSESVRVPGAVCAAGNNCPESMRAAKYCGEDRNPHRNDGRLSQSLRTC